MMWSDDYNVSNRKTEQAATLTREEWCEVLLTLGPDDRTDAIYSKLESQLNIFSGNNNEDQETQKQN